MHTEESEGIVKIVCDNSVAYLNRNAESASMQPLSYFVVTYCGRHCVVKHNLINYVCNNYLYIIQHAQIEGFLWWTEANMREGA
jgi:hypothetical protein